MIRPSFEVVVEDPGWAALDLDALADAAFAAGAGAAGLTVPVEVSVLAASDARIAELNGAFRGKAAPTNVLSWPSAVLVPPEPPEDPEIGDIALGYETCAREAREGGKSLKAHTSHLLIHGFLHLLGYDHEDDADATRMEGIEIKALETLGIENPY